MMERPAGVEYEGPSGIGRESMWLTAEDLVEGQDVQVTIEKTELFKTVKFQEGRVRTNVLAVHFVGKERVLGLNRANTKALNKMFGSVTKNWKGKEVTLFVADVIAFGETVKGVRIRVKGARPATAAEQLFDADHEPTTGGKGKR